MCKSRRHSCFTVEVHVRYLRELNAGDPVRVTFQLLNFDAKRMHYFEQLIHATEGWVSATSENMSLHVDMTARKSVPFPEDVSNGLARMRAAHARLPRPHSRRPPHCHAGDRLTPPLSHAADAIFGARFHHPCGAPARAVGRSRDRDMPGTSAAR